MKQPPPDSASNNTGTVACHVRENTKWENTMMQAKSKRRALSAVFGLSLAVVPVFTQQTKQSADYKAPLEVRREFFNGIHVAKDDPKFQMEAQHYCSPLKNGMFQCVLFDSTGADAKLMGIEYIIS